MTSPAVAFDLQGHRGARGIVPENTLYGFERALAIGVTTLELDIAITRDGVPIISHDPRPNPDITRDGAGQWVLAAHAPFSTMDWSVLRAFDVGRIRPGSDYARRFPFQKSRDGTRIPRLADLFALTSRLGANDVRFNIETKIYPDQPELTVDPETFARKLIDEIRRAGLQARATIQSFDWRTLAVVQREAPEIGRAYLTAQQTWTDNIQADRPGGSIWTAGVKFSEAGSVPRMVKAAGGDVWSPYHLEVDAAKMREARAIGLRVIPWTVNTRPDIERLLGLGVDGLISDYPDVARGILMERNIPVAPPVKRSRAAKKS